MNYSKWDHIDLSDDEDVEVHPNIDRDTFLRWRKESMIIEAQKKEEKRREDEKALSDMKEELFRLKAEPSSSSNTELEERVSTLEKDIESLSTRLQKEKEFEEKHPRWNSDNLSKEVFQKTIVNKDQPKIQEIEDIKTEDVKQFASLKTIEESYEFVIKNSHFVFHPDLLKSVFAIIMNHLKEGRKEDAKTAVRQYLLIQYCQSANRDNAIYWIFKRLLNPKSEQREEFERESEERFKQLEVVDQFKKPVSDFPISQQQQQTQQKEEQKTQTQQKEEQKQEQVLDTLPEKVRNAITSGNEKLLNDCLRGMQLEEMEEVLTKCRDADLISAKEGHEELYNLHIKKIRALKDMPLMVRFALQSGNTENFMSELRKLPFEQSSKVIDDCIESKIISMAPEVVEGLKESFKKIHEARESNNDADLKRMELFEKLPQEIKRAIASRDEQLLDEYLGKLEPTEREKVLSTCEEAGFIQRKPQEQKGGNNNKPTGVVVEENSQLALVGAFVALLIAIGVSVTLYFEQTSV